MSRTAAMYKKLLTDSAIADPAGVTCTSGTGNGVQIPATLGGGALPESTLLRVANASGDTATLTIKAGLPPLTFGDDLDVDINDSTTQWIGPLESSRFLQNDGSLICESTATLTVTAFLIERR